MIAPMPAKVRREDSITLVIPTYNRPDLLLENLTFLRLEGWTSPVLVVDSSESPVRTTNRDVVEACGLKATYMNTGPLEQKHKWMVGLSEVKTPYMILCADDDFIVPKSIYDQLDFLNANPTYSCVDGIYVRLDRSQTGASQWLFNEYYLDSLEQEDRWHRLFLFLERYEAIFYGVVRTSEFRERFKNMIGLDSILLMELFLSTSHVFQGKFKRLNQVSNIRRVGPSAIAKTTADLNEWLLHDPRSLLRDIQTYLKYWIDKNRADGDAESRDVFMSKLEHCHIAYLKVQIDPQVIRQRSLGLINQAGRSPLAATRDWRGTRLGAVYRRLGGAKIAGVWSSKIADAKERASQREVQRRLESALQNSENSMRLLKDGTPI